MSPQVIGTARPERAGHLQRPRGVAMSNVADEINDRSDAEPGTARAASAAERRAELEANDNDSQEVEPESREDQTPEDG